MSLILLVVAIVLFLLAGLIALTNVDVEALMIAFFGLAAFAGSFLPFADWRRP